VPPEAVPAAPYRWLSRLRRPSPAGLVARARAIPASSAWLLLATIALAAPIAPYESLSPLAGLDTSWATGLNIARLHRLRFGPELVFSYGPWGFLDHPSMVSRLNLVAGVLFATVAAGSAWLAFRAALRVRLGQHVADVAASLLVIICALNLEPSAMLMAAMLLVVLCYLDTGVPVCTGRWIPAATAGCAALLVQVKLYEGALLAVGAMAAALFGPAQRRRLLESAAALGGGSVLAWVLIGQPVSDLPAWLREAFQVASGYSDASALEGRPNVLLYLLIAGLVGLVAGYLVRLGRSRPARVTAGVVLVAVLALYFGFREGTGRHGAGHQRAEYVCALPILAWSVAAGRRVGLRLGVLVVVVLLVGNSWLPLYPSDAVNQWGVQLQLLVDTQYRTAQVRRAEAVAQNYYALSPQLRAALTGHPVSVEPWETTLAWAYGLNWRPAPVFQNYVAYTAQLDELNAAFLSNAGGDQKILRATGTNSVDGRNRLWDPPRQMLAELCHYRPQLTDTRWMLLAKAADRCGPAQSEPAERVNAGQQLSVPTADDDSLVTMSFVPDDPDLAVRLGRLVDKSFHPLTVTADGARFRLPRPLADGPLIVSLPDAWGWPTGYGGGTAYRTVSFSEPGHVSFTIIPLG
jgi:hypothetical protein